MRSSLVALLVLGSLSALPESVAAGVVNGGFEAGNFTAWSTAGDAGVVTAAIGDAPIQGTYQALLTTASQNGDLNNFSGTDAATAAAPASRARRSGRRSPPTPARH